VAEAEAAGLELRHRPIARARRETLGGVGERRLGGQHLEHLQRIGLPVGCAVQIAVRREAAREQLHERRLDQAPLVVARLVPWVRKKDMHAGQRARSDHPLDDIDRVVLDQSHVRESALVDLAQERADAGRVDFDADEIGLRQGLRDGRGGIAHAEADLEHERGAPAEEGRDVDAVGGKRNEQAGPELGERARLPGPHPAGPHHEAADRAAARRRLRGIGMGCRFGFHGAGPMLRAAGRVLVDAGIGSTDRLGPASAVVSRRRR